MTHPARPCVLGGHPDAASLDLLWCSECGAWKPTRDAPLSYVSDEELAGHRERQRRTEELWPGLATARGCGHSQATRVHAQGALMWCPVCGSLGNDDGWRKPARHP